MSNVRRHLKRCQTTVSSFGDRVRIKSTPETIAAGLAGLEADVNGFTTPSVTNVEVIGGAPDDCAINVSPLAGGDTYWLRPDLLEVLHHNPGMELKVGNMKAVRRADGTWDETVVLKHRQASWFIWILHTLGWKK
jgi:hypothetical protein